MNGGAGGYVSEHLGDERGVDGVFEEGGVGGATGAIVGVVDYALEGGPD